MDFQNQGQNQIPDNVQNNIPYGAPGNIPVQARPLPQKENSMSTAALTMAVIGCLTLFIMPVYLPTIFAGISIVLALLSKGSNPRFSPRAMTGMIASICSLVFNMLILILCFYLVFTVPEFHEQFEQTYEQIYGESFDDTLNGIMEER